MDRPSADDALAQLSPRDRTLLRAIGAGRCTVSPGPGSALLVDGRCCADQFAGHRLLAAGWVRTADDAETRTAGRPVELTPAGRNLLAGRASSPEAGRNRADGVDLPA